MPNKTVTLLEPFVAHERVTQLEFREPKWAEIMEIGEPYVWTPSASNEGFVVPTPLGERVMRYAERLIMKGEAQGDPTHLSRLGIRDTYAVRDAIMDFFLRVDPRVTAGSTPSSTTSSSTSNGASTSSAG